MRRDRGQMCGPHPVGITLVITLVVGYVVITILQNPAQAPPPPPVEWGRLAIVMLAFTQITTGIALVAWLAERVFRDPEDYNMTFRDTVGMAALWVPVRVLMTIGRVRAADRVASIADHTVYRDGDRVILTHYENRG